MSKTKHTPGPWKVIEEYDGWAVIKPDKGIGTMFIAKDINQGHDMGQADAKLIAAAPELLEALDSLVSGYHHGMGTSAMQIRFDIARDILNKAKGI